MNGSGSQDPFSWDIETVGQELATYPRRLAIDPEALKAKLRENCIDGETLLTFESLFSKKELMECLDIKLAGHKVAFAKAIHDLKFRSRGFKQWKRTFDREQRGLQDDDEVELPGTEEQILSTAPVPTSQAAHPVAPFPHVEPEVRLETQRETQPQVPHQSQQEAQQEAQQGVQQEVQQVQPQLPTSFNSIPPTESDQGPPAKRKRQAPINLTTRPVHTQSAFIPTEADVVSQNHQQEVPLDVVAPPRLMEWREGSLERFATVFPNDVPFMQRLPVYRRIRRLLVRNGRRALDSDDDDDERQSSTTPSEILLTDLPDDFDDETWAEIEEELREAENCTESRYLSQEQISAILDEAIAAITSSWEEKKLPKYQRQAHSRWNAAQRGGRKSTIVDAHQRAKHLDARIKKLCGEIMEQKWQGVADVRRQAGILEQSVEDKLFQMWLATTLESRDAPPKPMSLPRPRRPAAERVELVAGEEVLTSSDEEDFIVPDDETAFLTGDPMDIAEDSIQIASQSQGPAIKEESPSFVDLTQVETPEKVPSSRKSQIFIDLTGPSGSQETPKKRLFVEQGANEGTRATSPEASDLAIVPPLDRLGNFEEIGAQPAKYWAKENDRWRLTICLMWKLPHNRRRALLDILQKPRDEVWNATMKSQMENPLEDASEVEGSKADESRIIAFEMTKIFLSFADCRAYKHKKVTAISQKRERFEIARKTWLVPFCAFLKDASSEFPQDSQIYTEEPVDDMLMDDMDVNRMDIDEENGHPQTRNPVRKEIVRNKEAVNLREMDRQRIQEQEARRLVLRKQLKEEGLISRDKERLIINDARLENDPVIYINDDIGKRIMDHQIDGVRFIWNNIVQSRQQRPGCLLAHTMGLGKTMQVITLLVTVREAASSQDPSVRSQIPKNLRRSQTLILVPAMLIENWMDELLMWAPEGLLGPLSTLRSRNFPEERVAIIKEWAKRGGVLIIGYEMFRNMMAEPEASQLLLEKPNLVVADEAHKMKNPSSKIHQVCAQFSTKNRIALTGSPLSNNVGEYWSMVHWIAPNFLGPWREFEQIYAKPIEQGLWSDSTAYQKRRAMKMLEALKKTVAPKVDRKTMSVVSHRLPPKSEFVLYITATPTQRELYNLYVEHLTSADYELQSKGHLALVGDMHLVCNHPWAFKMALMDVAADPTSRACFPRSVIQPALQILRRVNSLDPELSVKTIFLTLILDQAKQIRDKVIVFTHSIRSLRYLENLCKTQNRTFCQLEGGTDVEKRLLLTRTFNKSTDLEVILVSTTAGGVGLNIHGANRVVIFDYNHNPSDEYQAVGRAYRIGQEKPVTVYWMVTSGSLEDDLFSRHVFKQQLSSRVVDKRNPIAASTRRHFEHPMEERPAENLEPFLGRDAILDRLIRHKPNGEFIRKIVTMDLYQEEDMREGSKLSAEEMKEAEDFVAMQELRRENPQAYQEQNLRNLAAAQLVVRKAALAEAMNHSMAQTQTLSGMTGVQPSTPLSASSSQAPSTTTPFPTTGLQGAIPVGSIQSQEKAPVSQPPCPPPASSSLPAPMPVAGANTYFGGHPRPTHPDAGSAATPSKIPATKPLDQPAPFAGGGIFVQSEGQFKSKFEKNLEHRIRELQPGGFPGTAGDPDVIAKQLTDQIHGVRVPQAQGFIYDDQQWRLLDQMLVHDRFVVAMVSGHVTPGYVAMVSEGDLTERIVTLNGLSDADFTSQSGRGVTRPDPDNLKNIGRSNKASSTQQSPQAKEDMKVMRQAADNRKHRGFRRLPSWANQALIREQERALPARGTTVPTEDRRSNSRGDRFN